VPAPPGEGRIEGERGPARAGVGKTPTDERGHIDGVAPVDDVEAKVSASLDAEARIAGENHDLVVLVGTVCSDAAGNAEIPSLRRFEGVDARSV